MYSGFETVFYTQRLRVLGQNTTQIKIFGVILKKGRFYKCDLLATPNVTKTFPHGSGFALGQNKVGFVFQHLFKARC